jgi:RES domain
VVVALDGRFLRLAFPLRSAATRTLVDSHSEFAELDELLQLTGAPADDVQAFVDRPFVSPWPSRFSDGSYGVLYSADSFQTAVRESAYHLRRLYKDGNPPAMATRRVRLQLQLRCRAEDVRRAVDSRVPKSIYDANDYAASQRFGAAARERVHAIHYDSVRNPNGGHCAAAFRRDAVARAKVVGFAGLTWDGNRFVEAFTIEPIGEP